MHLGTIIHPTNQPTPSHPILVCLYQKTTRLHPPRHPSFTTPLHSIPTHPTLTPPHTTPSLSVPTRKLLVSILLVIAKIFPERTCSELLTAPSLLELSATIAPGIKSVSTRAHKASQILIRLVSSNVMPLHTQIPIY